MGADANWLKKMFLGGKKVFMDLVQKGDAANTAMAQVQEVCLHSQL
jgi:hypothetical protein